MYLCLVGIVSPEGRFCSDM